MITNIAPKAFTPITVTFDNEAELHDVVAALAAYNKKLTSVKGTDIAEAFKLRSYTGNARKTVRRVLEQFQQALA